MIQLPIITIVNIVVMYLLVIPFTASYLRMKNRDKFRAVLVKGLCTASILVAALAGLTIRNAGAPFFDVMIVLGLTMGLIGDVVIGRSIVAGGSCFALGHFAYIAALGGKTEHLTYALPIWVALCVVFFVIYKISGLNAGKMEKPMFAYGTVIFAMLSLAVTVPAMLPAALLFTASDTMLGVVLMGNKNKRLDQVSLWCYFIAQSLFALSVIIPQYI